MVRRNITLGAINDLILGDAGLALDRTQLIEHPASMLIARLLALACLYHYLNWFSKVDLIGWARISPSRTGLIASLWLATVALYFYNDLLGFMVLLALSFMHVVLEFPLNHRSFREIGGLLRKNDLPLQERPKPGLIRFSSFAWKFHQSVPEFFSRNPPVTEWRIQP